jgi:cysteine desulfurase family protein
MIYLNNAATSYPKPHAVHEAIASYLASAPFHAGRVGFDRQREDAVWTCRERLATLFGVEDPTHIVFTSGATESLNLALLGSNLKGHVVTTALEHNSVLRPLQRLRDEQGLELTVVDCDANGQVAPSAIARAMRPDTGAIVVNHSSNVTGAVLDLQAIGQIARRQGALFVVDASQSAGVEPIDVRTQGIDLLAFAGHKSLYGVPGIGGLYMREALSLRPLKVGGTGVRSDLPDQPREMPLYYEAGTANMPGIVALSAGVDFVLREGVDAIAGRKRGHIERLVAELESMPTVVLYAPDVARAEAGLLSFNLEGIDPEDAGYMLESSFGIVARTGLHCAPLIHRALGSFPAGSIRVSPSYFTTSDDIDRLIEAVKAMADVGAVA